MKGIGKCAKKEVITFVNTNVLGVPLGIELDEDALTRVALGVVATLQHSEPNHKSGVC
jgi:hypothetical protein